MKISEVILDSNGNLPSYAFPGGYPMFYMDRENSVLCAECASRSHNDPDEVPQFKPVVADINYEDTDMFCDQCSAEIESAYAQEVR